MGTSFHGSLAGKPGDGSYARGLCVEEGSGTDSFHIGAPFGNLGRGGPSIENTEI